MMRSKKSNRWQMIDQSFLSLFVTFSIIQLVNRGSGIIDGVFVSRFLDADSIASVGIAKSIYSMTGVISGLFAVSMQSKCSHELGKGDVRSFNRIFSACFYIAAIISLLCMVLLLTGAKPLAILMGASGKGASLVNGAAAYLRGVGIGLPAIVLAPLISSACQLDSAKSRVRKSSLVYFVTNCLFDLISVLMGFGVFGIGLATALGYYAQLAYLMFHFTSKDRMLRFTKLSTSLKEMKDTLSMGTEKALRSLSNFITPVLLARIVIHFGGTVSMSAFSIAKDVVSFVEVFSAALADAVALQAGVYFGEMNGENMKALGKSAHRFIFLFLGTFGVLLIVFARWIAGIYISEQGKLFDLVCFSTVITGIYAPLCGLTRSRISYLNSIRKIWNMRMMMVLSAVIYAIGSAWILGLCFGIHGVLACNLVCIFLQLVTVWGYYAFKTRKMLPSVDDYLALPKGFELHPGDIISLDIRDADDISIVAEQIQLFCCGHKVDKKTGLKAALCFEELARNIIQFGFPKCRKQPCIDLRIVFADRELVMRLRDNCPQFDVERHIAQEICKSEKNEGTKIGLKMVSALAENIKYVHSLETNNIILRFPLSYFKTTDAHVRSIPQNN